MTAPDPAWVEAALAAIQNGYKLRRERDAALAEVERVREVARANFDLFHEAQREKRDAVQERDLARAEVAALRERLSDTALDIAEYRRAWLARWRRCPVQNDEAQP